MKRLFTILATLVFCSANAIAEPADCYPIEHGDLYEDSAPKYEQYLVSEIYQGKTAELDLKSNKVARRFKTMLTQGLKKGANFAGDMSVVGWGCGTGCVEWAVVNVKKGKVYTDPNRSWVSNYHGVAELPEFESKDSDYWGIKFRKDSRLLVLLGIIKIMKTRKALPICCGKKITSN